jgi:hypothetical protein
MIDEEIEDYDDFLDYVKYYNLGYEKSGCDSFFSGELNLICEAYLVYNRDCESLVVFHKNIINETVSGPYGMDGIYEVPYKRCSREYFWYVIGFMIGVVDKARGVERSHSNDTTALVLKRMWVCIQTAEAS